MTEPTDAQVRAFHDLQPDCAPYPGDFDERTWEGHFRYDRWRLSEAIDAVRGAGIAVGEDPPEPLDVPLGRGDPA